MKTKQMTFEEKLASGYYTQDAKPKPVAVVTVPVSDGFAQVAAGDPESVRVHARRADGVTVMEKPKRNDIVTVRYDLVHEIDEHGRPVWSKVGVRSDYDPMARFEREFD